MANRTTVQIMNASQQSIRRSSAAEWPLVAGQVLRLTVGPGPRWLTVTHGRLWLTSAGDGHEQPEDLVLEAGDQLAMAEGSDWVVEAAWGETRFQLLVPPQVCPRFVGQALGWAVRARQAIGGWSAAQSVRRSQLGATGQAAA